MITMIKIAIRDWWRGYTTADILSIRLKMNEDLRPGDLVPVTSGELKALIAVNTFNGDGDD